MGPFERALSTVRLDSIKNRILALAVVATLVPSLGTAILSYGQSREALTENLNGELRSRGSQGAREVDLWVKERSYDVRVFTGSFEVSENLDRIRQGGAASTLARNRLRDYLVGVHGRFTDYDELLVSDAEGQAVASSSESPGEVTLSDEMLIRLARGETVLGEPEVDAALDQTAVTLTAPIETGDARFMGVLTARLTFAALDSLLEDVAPGEGGRIDLVTSEGLLIATSDAAAGGGRQQVHTENLASLAEADGASIEYVDRTGTPVVGTLTRVPGLTWSVIAQIPSAEAYAQVADLRNSALLLVTILLVVVGGLAYLLGTVIVRPLARLTEGAGAVAAGDLSIDLPEAGRGEVGYLTQVFNDMVGRLRRSREELAEQNRELERLSVTDLLTGLHNRRYLIEAFEKEIQRADRHERPFCVIMLDVDRFKPFNDTYGHLAGDQVLEAMGRVLRDATRDLDILARFGGEEFLALLPECDLENGVKAAERIRARLAKEPFEHGPVTISIGVAEFPMHGDTPAAVIGTADEALYEAKARGRDRVHGAATPPSPGEGKKKASKRTAAAKKKRA
ncbi:MAG TPA: diguanylate cyclase [Longimicrobiales bacterium]|nr:diguanylate cyclase [Longimicrobiales bacterium]